MWVTQHRISFASALIRLTNADVLDQSALYSAASASHSGKTIGEGGMTAMRIVNTSSTRPTFNIIEQEKVFVNPFITLTSQFSQSPLLKFAIHNIVDARVVVNERQQ